MTTNTNIWQHTLEQLKLQMTQATFDTWLANTTAELTGNTLTITLQNDYAKDWLENQLLHTIQRTTTRVAGHPLQIAFTVKRHPATGPGSGVPPSPEPEAGSSIPPNHRFGIEIVEFDPTTAGWVMTSNYAWQFWQPLLGAIPFNLWNTLRSFPAAYHHNGHALQWPTVQTLADICANGNRHKILGRAARPGRKRTVGALETLEKERIVWTRTYGTGDRDVQYYFRVLSRLPLLTPTQVGRLTKRLQERHQRQMARCQLDYEEWKQLTLPSLLMAGP